MTVRIASSCRVAPLTAAASNDNGLQTAGLPIGGLAIAIGRAVGALLGLVGLNVIVSNANEPTEELILRLVEELQQDPDTGNDIETRTREKEESCDLDFERFGMGSFALPEFEETWNEFGNNTLDKIKGASDEFGFFQTTGEFIAEDWEFHLAALINCVEIEIENNIRCNTNEPPPRCRVPATVRVCVLREGGDVSELGP